ncbi:MAG: hypothetical protein JST46_17695 [Bacteroidetes bacterium]|nr:hypothetical protein [Bacteroidota bacterium]
MMTNLFHSNPDLIGITIERMEDGGFVICSAYKVSNKWTAKTLGGISGDLDDKKLLDQVIQRGYSLDKENALKIFSHLTADKSSYTIN